MPEDPNDLPADDVENDGEGANGAGGEPNDTTPKDGDGQPGAGDNGDGQPNDKDGKPDADQGGDEPPVSKRKTVKDFIIARKEAKIEKLKAQKAGGGDDGGDQTDYEEDDDLDPDDKERILKTVTPLMQPFIDKTLQAEDNAEVDAFIAKNPEFSPYAAKARKFMSHETRRHIPIETIFMEVVGVDGMMKLGAQRLKNANDKAKNGQTGGGSPGEGGGKKSWANATPAEMEAERARIYANRRR